MEEDSFSCPTIAEANLLASEREAASAAERERSSRLQREELEEPSRRRLFFCTEYGGGEEHSSSLHLDARFRRAVAGRGGA